MFISDEFVEDGHCQSLFLHVRNRMKKDFLLLMVGKERNWMNSALGGHVAGKVCTAPEVLCEILLDYQF